MVDNKYQLPRYCVVGLACAALSACYTGAASPADGDGEDDAADEGIGDTDEPDTDGPSVGDPDAECNDDTVLAALPNLVRLTHRQYDNTIRDLVGIDDHPSSVFLPDAAVAGYDNNAEMLIVGDRLARDYRRAAEDLAGRVLADPVLLGELLPCDAQTGDTGCAELFIADLGARAFRRELTDGEQAAYVALHATGAGLYGDGSAFEQGIRLVLEAMLQSPNLLYRVELSSPMAGESSVPLSGPELATRLSYLLWNSMPDTELLDAALAGDLDSAAGLEEQARRLLADPRARDPVADFHAQWLQVSRYVDVTKDPEQFPEWNAGLGDAMQQESRRFIERVVFELAGGYAELMTSPTSVVDDRLAALYGVAPTMGSAFAPVDLDPASRAGILTQIGFLASRAYADQTSPIHRGVFVQRQLLCAALPDPPPNIDPNLPPLEGDVHTTRDAVDLHTSPADRDARPLRRPSRLPLEGELLPCRDAVPKIEIDERLVRDASILCERVEVRDRIGVQANRDLSLQPLRVGIAPRLGEVVVLFHRVHLSS